MIGPVAAAVVANNPWRTAVLVVAGVGAGLIVGAGGSTKPIQDGLAVVDVPLKVIKQIKYGDEEMDLEQERARPSSAAPAFFLPMQGRVPARADGCEEVYRIRSGTMGWSCPDGRARAQEARG